MKLVEKYKELLRTTIKNSSVDLSRYPHDILELLKEKDDRGRSIVHFACSSPRLLSALLALPIEDTNCFFDNQGMNILHWAAATNSKKSCELILKTKPHFKDLCDRNAEKPVHKVFKYGHINLIYLFMQHLSPFTEQNINGETPFMQLMKRYPAEALENFRYCIGLNIQNRHFQSVYHLSALSENYALLEKFLNCHSSYSTLEDSKNRTFANIVLTKLNEASKPGESFEIDESLKRIFQSHYKYFYAMNSQSNTPITEALEKQEIYALDKWLKSNQTFFDKDFKNNENDKHIFNKISFFASKFYHAFIQSFLSHLENSSDNNQNFVLKLKLFDSFLQELKGFNSLFLYEVTREIIKLNLCYLKPITFENLLNLVPNLLPTHTIGTENVQTTIVHLFLENGQPEHALIALKKMSAKLIHQNFNSLLNLANYKEASAFEKELLFLNSSKLEYQSQVESGKVAVDISPLCLNSSSRKVELTPFYICSKDECSQQTNPVTPESLAALAEQNNFEDLNEYLQQNPDLITARDNFGCTPLQLAITRPNCPIKHLLEWGSNPNSNNFFAEDAADLLMLSSLPIEEKIEKMKLLVEFGYQYQSQKYWIDCKKDLIKLDEMITSLKSSKKISENHSSNKEIIQTIEDYKKHCQNNNDKESSGSCLFFSEDDISYLKTQNELPYTLCEHTRKPFKAASGRVLTEQENLLETYYQWNSSEILKKLENQFSDFSGQKLQDENGHFKRDLAVIILSKPTEKNSTAFGFMEEIENEFSLFSDPEIKDSYYSEPNVVNLDKILFEPHSLRKQKMLDQTKALKNQDGKKEMVCAGHENLTFSQSSKRPHGVCSASGQDSVFQLSDAQRKRIKISRKSK